MWMWDAMHHENVICMCNSCVKFEYKRTDIAKRRTHAVHILTNIECSDDKFNGFEQYMNFFCIFFFFFLQIKVKLRFDIQRRMNDHYCYYRNCIFYFFRMNTTLFCFFLSSLSLIDCHHHYIYIFCY